MSTPTISCNGVTVPIAIDGHARISNSLGAHLFAEENDTFSLVVSNGWVGHSESLGGVFFDAIVLNMGFGVVGLPVVAHATSSGGRVVIGSENGILHNYLAPRAIHVYRFARQRTGESAEDAQRRIWDRPFRRGASPYVCAPNSLAYLKSEYDGRGTFNLVRLAITPGFGPFIPEGGERGDDPGGTDINPFPGWDRSPLYQMTRHMMRMNRTPVAWIDSATGEPILRQRPEYFDTRSWNKAGVLSEFVMARSMSPWEDNRIPRDVNNGSCSYRFHFVPEQVEGQWTYPYEADNGEHLVRATAASKALRYLYRDKAAALTLKMIAADAWASWQPQAVARGTGLDGPLRDDAWRLDALMAAGYEAQAGLVARNLDSAQMPCGGWQRVRSSLESVYGHSPSPWRDEGMPYELDASSSKENAYAALAMLSTGRVAAAEKCAKGMYREGDPQIWQAVTNTHLANRCTRAHYELWQHWPMLGALGRLDASWRRTMARLKAPDATEPCGTDIKGALLRSGKWDAVACALESLEK